MNKLFWKKIFDESNLLIIIPAIVIVGSLVWFLIFGLSNPDTSRVDESFSIVTSQKAYEDVVLSKEVNVHTKDNPYFILDPYKMAPLSGLLIFDVDVATQFKVVIKGKTIEADFEYITESLTSHIIPIYGLYPGFENIVELYEFNGVDIYTLVNTQYIETEVLPESITLPTLINTTYEYFQDNLMVTMSTGGNLPVGYDFNGDVRWYLSSEFSWSPKQLENGHFLLGGRDLLSPYYSSELLEIDYLGKVYAQYNIPGGYHHEYVELPSGNLLVATNDFDNTVEDIVVEIDRVTGEIVKTIDMADYINPLDGASEMWTLMDWFHLTSIDYDVNTDSIILSGSYQDIIISIGYTSNELNWVIGDPTNWDVDFVATYFFTPVGDNFSWQYAQNDVMVLDNGDIFIFDNGVNKSKLRETDISILDTYSRGVIFRIDTSLMTIEQVFDYGQNLNISFYSPYNSNVDYYSEGNYLLHSGGHGMIEGILLELPIYFIEDEELVDKLSITIEVIDGVEVYRMEIEDNLFQAMRIGLYDNTVNYVLGTGISVGPQQVTPQYESNINRKFNLLDTVPPGYDLEFEKEFDRLIIKGLFNQGQNIYIILENSNEKRQYLIPTVENSFLAVCFDECHDGTLEVSYFINEEGVSGKYNIYIIIDGKKYNTYKSVVFE